MRLISVSEQYISVAVQLVLSRLSGRCVSLRQFVQARTMHNAYLQLDRY